jgi:hypothetical protein
MIDPGTTDGHFLHTDRHRHNLDGRVALDMDAQHIADAPLRGFPRPQVGSR